MRQIGNWAGVTPVINAPLSIDSPFTSHLEICHAAQGPPISRAKLFLKTSQTDRSEENFSEELFFARNFQ